MLITLNSTSFHPDDLTIVTCISACLTYISCWMKDHHLQLNLAKTELLVVSANPSLHHNFTFQLGSSTITSSKTARNLGVVIDDKLNFSDHIAKTARSCRFALYKIRKIRPFLSEHLHLHFTFMHLADAFIQSDLHCIQVTVLHLISSCFPWESNPWSWRC